MNPQKTDNDELQHLVPEESPISKNRKCTDMFCLLIFILFWVGTIVIIVVASKSVNTNSIGTLAALYLLPGDQLRRMCGFGQSKQPDAYAVDYSSLVSTA